MKKYTDKQLIKKLQIAFKKYGRTPKRREVKQNQIIKKRFGSWNNALLKAGLKPLKRFDYTEIELIKIIREWAKKNKRTPRMKDFYDDIYLPDPTMIKAKFNLSWQEIMIKAELKPNLHYTNSSKLNDNELLEILKKDFNRSKSKSIKEFRERKSNHIPSISYLKKRYKVTENGLLKLIGITPFRIKNYGRDELTKKLQIIYKTLGRTPSITDLKIFGLNDSTFKYNFGTWLNAVKEAGLPLKHISPADVIETKEELLQLYKSFSKKIGKGIEGASANDMNNSREIYNADVFMTRFGSMYELKIAAGFKPKRHIRKKYTIDELINILIGIYKNFGRIPSDSELKKLDIPSLTTFKRYFKTTKMSDVWKEVFKNKKGDIEIDCSFI